MSNYIVATIKPWNIDAYRRNVGALPGTWHLVTEKDGLTADMVKKLNPRYIFFPHWSWIVPREIRELAECVCFHMADVPYGRGGSPLQNLVIRGHRDTVLTALRMVDELDAGPVYLKKPLSLAGSATEIFERAAQLVYDEIREIVEKSPQPVEQTGDPVVFARRTPEMSAFPTEGGLEHVYNHVRMLDAETYPRAFLRHGDFMLEFSSASMDGEKVRATVEISLNGRES